MTCHSDALARVGARVAQGLVQGFSRRFLRLCKGCNGSPQPCLTYMCAHARLRMCVRLHKTLATLATLALSKNLSFLISDLASHDPARVTQGFGSLCKGLGSRHSARRHSPSPATSRSDWTWRPSRASGGGSGAAKAGATPTPPGGSKPKGGRRARPHTSPFRDFLAGARFPGTLTGRCMAHKGLQALRDAKSASSSLILPLAGPAGASAGPEGHFRHDARPSRQRHYFSSALDGRS